MYAQGRLLTQPKTEKAAKGKAGRPKKDASSDDEEVPAGSYEVEAIRDAGIDDSSKEHMYLVKWKSFPESDNTWEPKKNLAGALHLVQAFDAQKKKETAAEKSAAKASAPKKAKAAAAVKKAAVADKGATKQEGKPAATRGRPPKSAAAKAAPAAAKKAEAGAADAPKRRGRPPKAQA